MNKEYKLATIAIHGGYQTEPTTKSVAVPLYQTNAYEFDSTEHAKNLFELKEDGNIYTRLTNPTNAVLEQRIAELDGGVGAVAFSSGHAAIFGTLANLSIPPKISVANFMGYLKGKSSLMIFDKHANLKYKFGNRKFWAEGYYVSTVGLNEATIKKYIQDQERHDIIRDKLTSREYQDPFKG